MTADMIDLKRTKAKGVEALKNFLEFAEKGRLQGEYVENRVQKDQGILENICQQIEAAGFRYQKAVGHSKFKVDIAVINPYNEEEYLLGIMLDGESYRQTPNTRDREVAQISVLNGLGWQLHRIWTMDWWDNREKEIAKLLQLLEDKKAEACRKYQKDAKEEKSEEQEGK
jgi:very-short-patch-repair endonuclease